jgi:hypothetical protein
MVNNHAENEIPINQITKDLNPIVRVIQRTTTYKEKVQLK